MIKYINADELYDAISDNWCGIGVCNINDILNFIVNMKSDTAPTAVKP